jgi:hypothetical protein
MRLDAGSVMRLGCRPHERDDRQNMEDDSQRSEPFRRAVILATDGDSQAIFGLTGRTGP